MVAVLPADFSLPPLGYLFGLLVAVGLIGGGLLRERPPVTDRVVLALAVWMVAGAGLSALSRLGAVPAAVAPLLGTPAVYLTTFALAGGVWLVAYELEVTTDRALAIVGGFAVLAVGMQAVRIGIADVWWPVAGVAIAAILAGMVWWGIARTRRRAVATAGSVGGLVVFGHALDGVSTAIGVDVLGLTELTPASRLLLEAAGALPTAGVLGTGWLFVAVKLAVAAAVVVLFTDYLQEEPVQARLLLAVIAAVGLGPGTHNLLLYAIG